MSYNVENLFDLVDNGTEYPEFRPGQCNWDRTTCEQKLDNIASVIVASHAGIVALCEIENANALAMLQQTLQRQHRPYRYSAIADKPEKTITCTALLSRFPIISQRFYSVAEGDSLVTRNVLEADVQVARACTLKVFVNHWPSREHPESTRIAAARVLAVRITQLPRGTKYIVAGDFNTDFDEWEKQRRAGFGDTAAITGLHHVLRTVINDSAGAVHHTTRADLAAHPDSPCLFDPWADFDPQKRYSYVYAKRAETPDHILLPVSMFDSTGVCYVPNSFDMFRWNGRLIWDGKPYRWKIDYTRRGKRHAGYGYSDHLPLLIRLRLDRRS